MNVSSQPADTGAVDLEAELRRLRQRVSELETELVETRAWAHRAVAHAQEQTYWLERWAVDLNALMERPGASELRAAARFLRPAVRWLRRMRRLLRRR